MKNCPHSHLHSQRDNNKTSTLCGIPLDIILCSQLDNISYTHEGEACQEHQGELDRCLPFHSLVWDFIWRSVQYAASDDVPGTIALRQPPTVLPRYHVCLQEIQQDTSLWTTLSSVLNTLAGMWLLCKCVRLVEFLMWARRWLHRQNAYHSSSIHPASRSASQAPLPNPPPRGLQMRQKKRDYHILTFCSYGWKE